MYLPCGESVEDHEELVQVRPGLAPSRILFYKCVEMKIDFQNHRFKAAEAVTVAKKIYVDQYLSGLVE